MRCRKFKESITPYLDGILSETEKETFLSHAGHCPKCAEELEAFLSMSKMLKELQTAVLPDGFHAATINALYALDKKTVPNEARSFFTGRLPRLAGAAVSAAAFLIVTSAVIAGIGGMRGNSEETGFNDVAMYSIGNADAGDGALFSLASGEAEPYSLPEAAGDDSKYDEQDNGYSASYGAAQSDAEVFGTPAPAAGRTAEDIAAQKTPPADAPELALTGGIPYLSTDDSLYNVCDISIETTDADTSLTYIKSMGFSETSSSVSNYAGTTTANISLSVPAYAYDASVEALSYTGSVSYQNECSYSLMLEITDTQAALSAKRGEYERLSSLLAGSDSFKSMLLIQERIDTVTSEIDNYESYLNLTYKKAANSVINVSLIEIIPAETTPTLFSDQIAESFDASINTIVSAAEWVIIKLADTLLPLLLIAAAALILFTVCVKVRRRRKG